MAELLIKAIDAVNSDSNIDRSGCYKKGYVVDIRPDGFPWGALECLPKFVIVKCPEITWTEYRGYCDLWVDNFAFTINSENIAQGRYTVRVRNNSASISGVNQITLIKINSFLLSWGCNNISFASDYVQFDFRLAQAVQSDGFWNIAGVSGKANFTIVNYNSTTGIGLIQAVIIDPKITAEHVGKIIINNGGTIISNIHPTYVFDTERSNLFAKFKNDIKLKSEKTFCRRKYYFLPADVDVAISNGGAVTLTKLQLLNKIKNKLDE